MNQPRRIAIVGAGMAGLACASHLHRTGVAVTVFDKGRRPGGRLATRRAGSMRFDHGGQYATARDPAFRAALQEAGPLVAVWGDRPGDPWWVGVPGMSALAQALIETGIGELQQARHVAFLHHGHEGWTVRHRDAGQTPPGLVSAEEGELSGPFDAVVLAIPSPQATSLLDGIGHPLATQAAAATMAPCWALMLAFPGAHPGPDTQRRDTGPLDWIARDSSRPGRPALPECWVAHASPAWSRDHLEAEPAEVTALLRTAFAAATGIDAVPSYAAVHRWRYARTLAPLGEPCLAGTDGLVACGDWCLGARVEAAFMSGCAAAKALA